MGYSIVKEKKHVLNLQNGANFKKIPNFLKKYVLFYLPSGK